MIRMTRQTDYAFVLLRRLAEEPGRVANAPELAAETRLPAPMVAKVLKLLTRAQLVASHRGIHGGYSLARAPEAVSAAEIVEALEGPVALTVCVEGAGGECERERFCTVRDNWQRINQAVRAGLAKISLAELSAPPPVELVQLGRARRGARAAR